MSFPALQAMTETLAWTLLHFLWQGVLIGALYGAARQLSGAVRWRHAVALVALVAVLAAPVFTFAWLQDGAGTTALAPAAGLAPATAPAAVVAGGHAVDAVAQAATGDEAVSPMWALGLVAAWLLGALVIAAGLFSDWRLIRRAIRHGVEPPRELAALFARQMERVGIRRRVRLRLTARITVPGVYGILRPIILLPTALALSLPREQLEALLLHELAHIRRADCIANTLGLAARTLLYFHPVVHWICRDLERTRETLCDDLVVELEVDRIGYARALSTAEQFRQQVPVPLLTATGGELTERVHRILALPSERPGRRERVPLLAALTAIGVALVALGGQKTDALLALARPEFRVVYQTLMAPVPMAPQVPFNVDPVAIAMPRIVPGANFAPNEPALDAAIVAAPDLAVQSPTEAMTTTTDEPAGVSPAGAANAPMSPMIDPVLDDADTRFGAAALDSAPAARQASASTPVAAAALPDAVPADDRAADEASARPQLRSTRRVEPYYPSRALREGVEGSVTVAFRLDGEGRPVGTRVIEAEPAGVFEKATLDAFAKWRYEATAEHASGEFTQVFAFSLEDDEDERCVTRTGTRLCTR